VATKAAHKNAARKSTVGAGETNPAPQFLILAQVLRPHGVRGDLSIKVLTDFPERMNELTTVYVGADPEKPDRFAPYQVEWARRAKKDNWLLRFEGVNSREDADLLRNRYILVSLADAVPLEADEIYLFQVLGLEVHTTDGLILGHLTDVLVTGANDVYVIKGEQYGEVLIPAIPSVIQKIDVPAGKMTVQLLEGLLPEPPAV